MVRSAAYSVEGSARVQPSGRVAIRASNPRLAIFRQGILVLFWVLFRCMLRLMLWMKWYVVRSPMPIRRHRHPVVAPMVGARNARIYFPGLVLLFRDSV